MTVSQKAWLAVAAICVMFTSFGFGWGYWTKARGVSRQTPIEDRKDYAVLSMSWAEAVDGWRRKAIEAERKFVGSNSSASVSLLRVGSGDYICEVKPDGSILCSGGQTTSNALYEIALFMVYGQGAP